MAEQMAQERIPGASISYSFDGEQVYRLGRPLTPNGKGHYPIGTASGIKWWSLPEIKNRVYGTVDAGVPLRGPEIAQDATEEEDATETLPDGLDAPETKPEPLTRILVSEVGNRVFSSLNDAGFLYWEHTPDTIEGLMLLRGIGEDRAREILEVRSRRVHE